MPAALGGVAEAGFDRGAELIEVGFIGAMVEVLESGVLDGDEAAGVGRDLDVGDGDIFRRL